eukprot:5693715-Pyramimonas_sp.AAC.1
MMTGMILEIGEVIGRDNTTQEGPVRLRRYRSDVHPEAGAPGAHGHCGSSWQNMSSGGLVGLF